jgi:hypothetical protein
MYFSLGSVYVSVWRWWRCGGAVGFLPSPNSPFSRTGQHGQSAVSAAPERCAVFSFSNLVKKNFVIFFFCYFYFDFFFSIFWEEKWKKKERFFCFVSHDRIKRDYCLVFHTHYPTLFDTHTIRCAFASAALRLFNNRFAVVNHVCCASPTPELSREAFTAILKSSEKKNFLF